VKKDLKKEEEERWERSNGGIKSGTYKFRRGKVWGDSTRFEEKGNKNFSAHRPSEGGTQFKNGN